MVDVVGNQRVSIYFGNAQRRKRVKRTLGAQRPCHARCPAVADRSLTRATAGQHQPMSPRPSSPHRTLSGGRAFMGTERSRLRVSSCASERYLGGKVGGEMVVRWGGKMVVRGWSDRWAIRDGGTGAVVTGDFEGGYQARWRQRLGLGLSVV